MQIFGIDALGRKADDVAPPDQKIDTLVVDKTGTLTEGRPVVTQIVAASGFELTTLEAAQADPAYEQDPDWPAAVGTTLQQQMMAAKGLTLDGPPDDTLARLAALCR